MISQCIPLDCTTKAINQKGQFTNNIFPKPIKIWTTVNKCIIYVTYSGIKRFCFPNDVRLIKYNITFACFPFLHHLCYIQNGNETRVAALALTLTHRTPFHCHILQVQLSCHWRWYRSRPKPCQTWNSRPCYMGVASEGLGRHIL